MNKLKNSSTVPKIGLMKERISLKEIQTVYRNSIEKEIIDIHDNSCIFFDLDRIINKIISIKQAFPSNTLHALAIKTNPLLKILEILEKENVGMEAASISEVKLARLAGYSNKKIVFDSPVKTKRELEEAINIGVHLNLDNFDELNRIKNIIGNDTESTFGLRINPQIGSGSINSMSVAGEYSKFGVPLKYYKKKIIKAFCDNNWLKGLHVHSGSQGLSLEKLSEGVKVIYELALEINNILNEKKCLNRIEILDIGGGLPIAYRENETTPLIQDYVNILSLKCPEIFSGKFKIITEFGRFIYGHSGWTLSRIEYLKSQPNVNTALIHVGADLFLRESYNPNDWYHLINTMRNNGELNSSETYCEYTIAGPLCFAGDIIQRNVKLPKLNEGDYIIIHDTGANNLNLWSRHCSREIPKVIGYFSNGERFEVLKKRENFSHIVKFWT